MKKIVIIINIFILLILCGCTKDTSGYASELTCKQWVAKYEDDIIATLTFKDEFATLKLKSGNINTAIRGKYAVDEKSFIIFMPEVSKNYTFNYVPNGDSLKIKYDNFEITMYEN